MLSQWKLLPLYIVTGVLFQQTTAAPVGGHQGSIKPYLASLFPTNDAVAEVEFVAAASKKTSPSITNTQAEETFDLFSTSDPVASSWRSSTTVSREEMDSCGSETPQKFNNRQQEGCGSDPTMTTRSVSRGNGRERKPADKDKSALVKRNPKPWKWWNVPTVAVW
ncbi:hypothetical protein EX30DRAFT_352655 [Ascodesmis nigricans]|uniref:Uncharacterized protein n=1 Tax=Ascodesmis nigricans TaxID=341454 RepID=A0A4S2MHQ2_9PEZI|nr:hypothetical protein EX30DRAFT_352655 [Ascodesmis nigricans]